MSRFSNPSVPIQLGLPRNVRRRTTEIRKHWSPSDLDARRREAITAQQQLAFLTALEPRKS